MMKKIKAPELITSQWFNSDKPITLESLRGKIVVIHAFQMLCPGCVSVALPQIQKAQQLFDSEHVSVIGLHTVFEHHKAMTPIALEAFIHEYRISFPVGVDMASENSTIPKTMAAYNMQGTPTMVLIDREGYIRKQKFGHTDDMLLGAEIASLIYSPNVAENGKEREKNSTGGCTDEGCVLD